MKPTSAQLLSPHLPETWTVGLGSDWLSGMGGASLLGFSVLDYPSPHMYFLSAKIGWISIVTHASALPLMA